MTRVTEAPFVADRVRFADFVIADSHHTDTLLRRSFEGTATPPIHVVYDGVDLERCRPAVSKREPADRPHLVCAGTLQESNGLQYLLRACSDLKARGVRFTCDIIGGPEPSEPATWVRLRKLHAELDLQSFVRFRGALPVESVLESFRQADVFALPCARARDGSENTVPASVLEAMATALPVVSTAVGALPEIVGHEVDGLLVPAGDERALAAAIERLFADRELRQLMGENARRTLQERFDLARSLERRGALFRA
jgi:glycosyltransferase involved in cell wall biosynthesis